QIVSAFFRLHPLIYERFAELYPSEACKIHSETVSIDLTLSDEALWSQTRPEHRTKINRCRRSGFHARQVTFEQNGEDFIEIYTETMNRVSASASFYFTRDYFLQLAEVLGESLHVCVVEFDQTIVCAGLFTECAGIVQYHLGGTRTAFLKQSPSVLMFDAMRSWAKVRGNHTLHLGGGVGGAADSLHHFKAGFSKRRHSLPLLRSIPHPELYQQLVELRAKSLDCSIDKLLQSGFFPAYRAVV
ncbi:GNAT family N-acetyltransferase, partial [Pseudanabaenaceae cyanobacterium LEGE 13415]|nr:GNAT family N-acetyltransferase [Pseudanabaenaceae cyanobacterium LEGE 13415]